LPLVNNVVLLAGQILKFRPAVVSVRTREDARRLCDMLGSKHQIPVLYDEAGAEEVAAYPGADMVLSAISGAAGLKPTMAAMEAGKDIALANKETMVIAGPLVTKKARQKNCPFFPWTVSTAPSFNAWRDKSRKI